MHKDILIEYLKGTDSNFFYNGIYYIMYKGRRKTYCTSEIRSAHLSSWTGIYQEVFEKDEHRFLKQFYGPSITDRYDVLVWDGYRWVETDVDKIFIEYCRKSVHSK